MPHKHSTVLTLILILTLLTGCLPRPQADRASTAAPFSEEQQTAAYSEEEKRAEQTRFDEMCTRIFREELSSSLLDLHFFLKDPSAFGITAPATLYASLTGESLQKNAADRRALKEELDSFPLACLTEDQKQTARILNSFLKTEAMAEGMELYGQPLSPTIGIQAELPILLCEYAFYNRNDIENYLRLLTEVDTCFQEILDFENRKAAAGLMSSDTTIDHILESCESYLLVPGDNFMIDTFLSRLDQVEDLSQEEKADYIARNAAALEQDFVPAYQLLIDGLTKLKGTGTNESGLCGYPEGEAYYRYLVYSRTGTSYSSVNELLSAMEQTMEANLVTSSSILSEHPEYGQFFDSYSFALTDPQAIMEDLKAQVSAEFPALPACSYRLKDIPDALSLSLSPAFYLTSPIDDTQNNIIYINRNERYPASRLYPTIAHEGYPGHLYQTVYFYNHCDSNLRKILSFPGYSEGWATYVELLSYSLDNGLEPEFGRLLAANSMATLGLHAVLDVYVNDRGWDKAKVEEYLSSYFENPAELTDSIYDTLVENPANYLSYYVGCMEIQNMRKTAEESLGADFQAEAFHQFLLDLGRAPFDVIQPYFTAWLNEQKLKRS